MKEKIKDLFTIVITGGLILGTAMLCWFKKPDDFSESERRVLRSFPELSVRTLSNGTFMGEFEEYAMDQFPGRDSFRRIKSACELFVFRKLDVNDLYIQDRYIAKIEYPMNEKMIDNAAGKFRYINDTYFADKNVNVYFSVIPDKNCFLAQKRGGLAVDFNEIAEKISGETGDFMQYIDISDLLSISDYYYTDTHWRQENITDVAKRLGEKMGVSVVDDYTKNTCDKPFYGVYYDQLALPLKPDELCWLTNETLENCRVTSYNNKYGNPVSVSMYDFEKASGRDPYEMFLNGSDPLVIIENPDAENDRELIIFRDSFGSSLAPLMVGGYSKITLVDIRYISSTALGQFIDFDDQDVLFLYSTLILNNSLALR